MKIHAAASLVLLSVAGCHQWQHSPGYDRRASMVKQELRAQTWQACQSGACDKDGPAGPVRYSNVRFHSVNGQRESTSFDVSYLGARARCRSTDRNQPLSCSIAAAAGADYRLDLGAGCTAGLLQPARAPSSAGWSIQTDSVAMAGHRFPAREVSLVDEAGVFAFSSAHGGGDNIDLFTRPADALSPVHLVALVAVQSFLQLEDLPAACITQT